MLDIPEIFDDPEFLSEIGLRRSTGQRQTDGTWSGTYGAAVPTEAIVHPTKPDDLQLLPEGERHLPSLKVFTEAPLAAGDLIDYQGHTWRVAALGDWSAYGFHNAVAVRHSGPAQPAAGAFVVA